MTEMMNMTSITRQGGPGQEAVRISCMIQGKPVDEVILMAKQGMARPDWTHTHPRNDQDPVPLIQGKAKHGKEKAKPIIPGTGGADLKVYHNLKGDNSVGDAKP